MKRITIGITAIAMALSMSAFSQTNVFDDIIVPSPDHSYLEAAILQEGLEGALQNNGASLTVFAPNNAAFDNLAAALNTDINGLLALPNLSDILLYHVLDTEVASGAVTNGLIAQPLSSTNSLKLTLTSTSEVFVNQSQVIVADLAADNGTVHVLDAVILPSETVVDVALDNGFTTLATAVIQEELLPVLTNPLAAYTVFAPTNQAFDDLAMALNTDINGLLADPELNNILLYHVIDTEVVSGDLPSGLLNTLNGQVSIDLSSGVMVNDAMVTLADVMSDNGVVHVIDKVLIPSAAGISDVSDFSIKIYPNPASNVLNIAVEDGFLRELLITDIYGKLIKRELIDDQPSILTDISTLPTGEYFITLNGSGTVRTYKISKL